MITSFACNDTKALFNGGSPAKFRAIAKAALRKLDMLDAACALADLRIPPGNRLEALSGDRQGQYSIRINARWRLCFRWRDGNAEDTAIVDYH